MAVKHDTWPSGGRLGLCTSGEYADCYALVTAEIDDYWVVYIAPRPGDSGGKESDDFMTRGDDEMQKLLNEMGMEWVPLDEEDQLEDQVFGLRRHWAERKKGK